MNKFKENDVVEIVSNEFVIKSVRVLNNGHIEYEGEHRDGHEWTLYECDVIIKEKGVEKRE